MNDDAERLAIAAAANVVFWGAISERLAGRSWPGVAASVAAMTTAARGLKSPALELLNLPGNVAAQVLQQRRIETNCPTCNKDEAPK